MYYVVGAIIAVILLLIIGLFYMQVQETKKRVAKQKALMGQSRNIQLEFKQQTQILMEANLINSQQKQKLCYLATNFFVFQTVNDAGVTNLQKMTDYFSGIVSHATSLDITDALIEAFASASNRVPYSARDFTSSFYVSTASQLLTKLNNDVNAIANGEADAENDLVNQEELPSSGAEATEEPSDTPPAFANEVAAQPAEFAADAGDMPELTGSKQTAV